LHDTYTLFCYSANALYQRQNEEMRTKFERDSAELVQCEHELRGVQANIDMSREGTNQLGDKLKHVTR